MIGFSKRVEIKLVLECSKNRKNASLLYARLWVQLVYRTRERFWPPLKLPLPCVLRCVRRFHFTLRVHQRHHSVPNLQTCLTEKWLKLIHILGKNFQTKKMKVNICRIIIIANQSLFISERKKIYTHPATYNTGMIKSSPMNVYMPEKFQDFASRIWNFVPRPDDIWIITYPKCGTTLTQELMWQIANGVQIGSPESQKNIFLRVPFIEFTALQTSVPPVPSVESDDPMSQMALMMNDTVAWTDKFKSPRIIKTHLPLSMLPPNLCQVSKVLYVGRNPMDNCVSFYHFEKLLPNQGLDANADFENYAKNFYLKGRLVYGDYWTHLKDAWKYKSEKNFKLVWYEDMRADLSKAIREIADFTGFQVKLRSANYAQQTALSKLLS